MFRISWVPSHLEEDSVAILDGDVRWEHDQLNKGAGALASSAAESHRVLAALRERTRQRRRDAAFLHRAMVDTVVARNKAAPLPGRAAGFGTALSCGPGALLQQGPCLDLEALVADEPASHPAPLGVLAGALPGSPRDPDDDDSDLDPFGFGGALDQDSGDDACGSAAPPLSS